MNVILIIIINIKTSINIIKLKVYINNENIIYYII